MNFKVCKLTKDMSDDYIDYFEHRAFYDGNIQKGCYCVWHHWTDKHEQERSLMPENERPYRKIDYAKELIKIVQTTKDREELKKKIAAYHERDIANAIVESDKTPLEEYSNRGILYEFTQKVSK